MLEALPATERIGYRGEPWRTDGKCIYDRDGNAFAEMHRGCAEFAQTIVACVNMLAMLNLRERDHAAHPNTTMEELCLGILKDELDAREREYAGHLARGGKPCGEATSPPRRTKAEVLEARKHAVAGGCCDRFADMMACDCLEKAEAGDG